MTDTSIEIACSLTEPEFRVRKDVFRRKLKPYLTSVDYSKSTSQLVFSKPEVTRELLEQLMEMESECCPFFVFELKESGRHFHLSITGPEGSEDMVRNFFSAADESRCGCHRQGQLSDIGKPKYIAGFITLCAIACAVPPLLAALGLVSVVTGAWLGKGVETVLILLTLIGLGYILKHHFKRKQRGVH